MIPISLNQSRSDVSRPRTFARFVLAFLVFGCTTSVEPGLLVAEEEEPAQSSALTPPHKPTVANKRQLLADLYEQIAGRGKQGVSRTDCRDDRKALGLDRVAQRSTS